MQTVQLARLNVGLGPEIKIQPATQDRPVGMSGGVDVRKAVMALVQVTIPLSPPGQVSAVTFDIYGRTEGPNPTWALIQGYQDIEIDDRGWKDTLRIPTESRLAVCITKRANVELSDIVVWIAPCLGGE